MGSTPIFGTNTLRIAFGGQEMSPSPPPWFPCGEGLAMPLRSQAVRGHCRIDPATS